MNRIFSIIFLIFSTSLVSAQTKHGLEKIIVEKYYVADSIDARACADGQLRAGSVVYRIFVDMLPAYRFQAAYGVTGHELRIATTTYFYNNENGAAIANDVLKNKLEEGTVMLDSWLSVCAGGQNMLAVLKSDDTSKAILNKDGLLQNADTSAGIPLKIRDGLYPATLVPVVTMFGMDSALLSTFKKTNTKLRGQVFSTDNASWASFGGTIGATPDNRVLIAQITTDGELSFELNIQIGVPGGGVENYVARNPVEKEILFNGLIYPAPSEKMSKSKKK